MALTGFRKGHSAQHSLLIMIEKWKRALDKNMKVGAISMDLSKAFDTLNHRLLLTKLKAYGLKPNALKNKWKTILLVVFKGQKSIIVTVHGLK